VVTSSHILENNAQSDIKSNENMCDNSLPKSNSIKFSDSRIINLEFSNLNSVKALQIYHQNICGLCLKVNELISHLDHNLPKIFFFSEHQLKFMELQNIYISNYKLGTCYCRNNFLKGEVCVFVKHNLKFSNVNLNSYCVEKDIELCAISLHTVNTQFYILSVYRSPMGNFSNFLQNLDGILRKLYAKNCEFIICDDFNINYLKANLKRKTLLNTMFASYNLFSTVNFAY
jgi:hypothetical protein